MCIAKPEGFEEESRDEALSEAMEAELKMIEKNQTWEVVDRSIEKPMIGVKWVFKTKLNLDEKLEAISVGCEFAFFNCFLQEEVYVDQPDGLIKFGTEDKKKYALALMDKFGLKDDFKPVSIPLLVNEKLKKKDGSEPADEALYRQMVGSLLYLTTTRPDIFSRFMHNPTKKYFGTAKRVLRYIKGILDYVIEYVKGKKAMIVG
ncbi:uncharacterized protein LOC126619695 [Malus sylvestris]|uniref:uncharacterized protein LOC126619695 n=1 Tax=Malus sylvestris TaxID=3752 RepID=UPI0021AD2334|nr:uncharacterized protein LOC126619695 [Malus sylvestris]